MTFPAKPPKMLTMTAVVITGRGARYERDLFADSAYRGLNQIFPPIADGELALSLWAHRMIFARRGSLPGLRRQAESGGHMTREQKAAEILKAHRAAAKIAKARRLSPAFNAQCAAEDAPEPMNPSLQYLTGQYGLQVLFFIGLLVFVIWAWPVIVMLAKGAVLVLRLIPFWIISGLTTPRRRYYRRSW